MMQSQMIATRGTSMEMQQKNSLMIHDSFFSLKGAQDRPVSVATEFMESDFEDDIVSEYGYDDGESSPRASLNSGQPSFTTISSYDEVPTPRSSQVPMAMSMSMTTASPIQIEMEMGKPVEGPRGPHLFRISNLSAEFENALSLSPVTPKVHSYYAQHTQAQYEQYEQYEQQAAQQAQYVDRAPPLPYGITPLPPTPRRNSGPFAFTHEELDTGKLSVWSPEHVAQWMLNAGIELQVCERFIENDITGSILITLKFEDLKELGIPSFGIRTNVWTQINTMKNVRPRNEEPRSETPIEDEPDRKVRREVRRMNSCTTPTVGPAKTTLRRGPSVRRLKNMQNSSLEDTISPLESVSIVGIEQVLPKLHQCSKGENCSKWRRQQRMIESFKREHPFADVDSLDKAGGIIMIAGDPGNPQTARSINPSDDEMFRPVSDAMPSVVASSDVMGPAFPPVPVALEAGSLSAVQSRDPQDNVRQFLSFQHQHIGVSTSSEVPPTPPFELFPGRAQATERLRALPKLAIPAQKQSLQQKRHSHEVTPNKHENTLSAHPMSAHPNLNSANYAYPLSSQTASAAPSSSTSYTNTAIEESPGRTPTAPYRFGTPFTEVDVPVTAVPTGPIARDTSQSVPPDMSYRAAPQRTMSRASARRPSFPVLPSLHENRVAAGSAQAMSAGQQRAASAMGHRSTFQNVSPTMSQGFQQQGAQAAPAAARQLQAPPRHVYPWSPPQKSFEKAIAPMSLVTSTLTPPSTTSSSLASASSSGSSSLANSTNATPASSVDSAKFATGGPIYPDGISYQGDVKKRKTKMLRHEWHDRFITLKGTRLAVHKDRATTKRTLEYVDIDDYAIACSTMAASTSKLNAAFKAMNIRRGSDGPSGAGSNSKEDVAAFAFQLIPQDSKAGVRLRKRDSAMPGASSSVEACFASPTDTSAAGSADAPAPGPPEASNGTGKTHHFAVKNRDDRIEWMRELMLAKAMRQKGAGFEVSVNGNMI